MTRRYRLALFVACAVVAIVVNQQHRRVERQRAEAERQRRIIEQRGQELERRRREQRQPDEWELRQRWLKQLDYAQIAMLVASLRARAPS